MAAQATPSPPPGKNRPVQLKKPSETESAPSRQGMGDLDPESIGQVVFKHKGEILRCYEKQLKQDPKLQGSVRVKFVILETGNVGRVKMLKDLPENKRVSKCIIQTMQLSQFPKPKGGSVTVSFHFVFKPIKTKAKPSP